MRLSSFKERFDYLKLEGAVGEETFGRARSLNQEFYKSARWRRVRNEVIARDMGRDLAIEGREIQRYVLVHHINPVTEQEILRDDPCLYDPENLICVSRLTHNAIHYGDAQLLEPLPDGRSAGDTCPWKGGLTDAGRHRTSLEPTAVGRAQ